MTGEYDAQYLPLDGAGINYESDETVHVIIVGMSRMGVAKERSIQVTNEEYRLLRNTISLIDGKLKFDSTRISENMRIRVNLLAELEHNRWNIEKLLMGYRQLTDDEKKALRDKAVGSERDNEKDRLKGYIIKAHADICSFHELKKIDPGIEDYDYLLTLMIPDIKNLQL